MNIALFLKNKLENIPEPIGFIFAKIPFKYRPGIGKLYYKKQKEIHDYYLYNKDDRQNFIFKRIYNIVDFAIHNIDFFKEHYAKNNFSIDQLKKFEDIHKIPIITKSILKQYDIEKRSSVQANRYIVNTGGSSGEPLSFYIEPSSMGHEWAHMHTIWSKLDYKTYNLKLVFAGRSCPNVPVRYDGTRHHYAVNVYEDYKKVVPELLKILKKVKIHYLHGYPSTIYEFALFCEQHNSNLIKILQNTLKGIFLSSEYPSPVYRDKIESIFKTESVSWYGHTERAILAYEKEDKYMYEPFQTYGYCEAVSDEQLCEFKLVGTSYHNKASPFIRYDTGDTIEPISEEGGILEKFKISSGREGEYIFDNNMKKIPLTGLIYGRHHKLFDIARFIQVSQVEPGKATILIVLINKLYVKKINWNDLFDTTGVAIDFNFHVLDQPIKTPSGKVKLLVESIQ